MKITGVRAFGRSEGGLSHTGDFVLLFSPVIPYLQNSSVFGPVLNFGSLSQKFGYDEVKSKVIDLQNELKALEITAEADMPKHVDFDESHFYGAGFFPKFAKYILDDGSELICFKKPYPEYKTIYNCKFKRKRTGQELRRDLKALSFFMLFQNIDARYWEAYIQDRELTDKLINHLERKHIDYELLHFEKDYPESQLKKPRNFKNVHKIWHRKREEN